MNIKPYYTIAYFKTNRSLMEFGGSRIVHSVQSRSSMAAVPKCVQETSENRLDRLIEEE